MKKFITGLFLLVAAVSIAAQSNSLITTESLLDEMTDRQSVSLWPDLLYSSKMNASFDKRTVSEKLMFANWDRSMFIRELDRNGRKEYVMMESDKPGVITRFWITFHGSNGGEFYNGTLRVYLNGSSEPVIEGPISDVISKQVLAGYPLSMSVSPETEYKYRGHNLYLPIPYAQSCLVTYESPEIEGEGALKGEALYYQIAYREYQKNTVVKDYSLTNESSVEVSDACSKLQADPDVEGVEIFSNMILEPGKSVEHQINGRNSINYLGLDICSDRFNKLFEKISASIKREGQILRSVVLEISFDGRKMVEVPAGAFFGTGYRKDEHKTFFTSVNENGKMESFFVMPFFENCTIRLINYGNCKAVIRSFSAGTSGQASENSLYFHADWNCQGGLDTNPKKRRIDMDGVHAFDINLITVNGKGRYLGESVTLYNSGDSWWGEGDENVYIDGEDFPSQIGTGTEDYFGYAWCRPQKFSTPFNAQPSGEGNLKHGYVVNSRFRLLDDILFEKNLRFDFEIWHWQRCLLEYSAAVYWYGEFNAETCIKAEQSDFSRPVIFSNYQMKHEFEKK